MMQKMGLAKTNRDETTQVTALLVCPGFVKNLHGVIEYLRVLPDSEGDKEKAISFALQTHIPRNA